MVDGGFRCESHVPPHLVAKLTTCGIGGRVGQAGDHFLPVGDNQLAPGREIGCSVVVDLEPTGRVDTAQSHRMAERGAVQGQEQREASCHLGSAGR